MQDEQTITMSSLIAGLFIAFDTYEISFDMINKIFNELFNNRGIEVEENDDDIDKIYLIVKFDDKKMVLNYNFDDLIKINGKKITVYEYLYGLTDELTRDYFDIEEKKNSKKRN